MQASESRRPLRHGLMRTGVLAAGALAVAEAAALLLRPSGDQFDPLTVDAGEYIDPGVLQQALTYRGDQRSLLLISLAIEAGALVALASGRPRFARAALERLGARPVLGAAVAGAALSAAFVVLSIPTGIASHENAVDAGISTQSIGGWLADLGRATAIGAVITGAGAAILIALVRRAPRRWWIAGAGVVVGYAVVFSWLAPTLLAPVFNDFERLPDGQLRTSVERLAQEAGVDVGEVYVVDASRRTTTLNAYVDGLGPTKRVVLYDNLLDADPGHQDGLRRELDSIVAHELAHVANRDIPRGILFLAIVAPLGVLFVRELSLLLTGRAGIDPGSPAALPAYALALALATAAINVPGNQLSRAVEAEADRFALELTDDPEALISLQTDLAESNLSDPDPPVWVRLFFGTHPTFEQRVGAALAFRERALE